MNKIIPKTLNAIFFHEAEAKEHNKKIKERKIVLIDKKSNKTDFSQIRPISVISTLDKVLSKIINIRLTEALEEILPRNILAYKQNNSPDRTIKYINDLKDTIIQQEENAIAVEVDFTSAYNVINRKYIYNLLEMMNTPQSIINKPKSLLEDNV